MLFINLNLNITELIRTCRCSVYLSSLVSNGDSKKPLTPEPYLPSLHSNKKEIKIFNMNNKKISL